MAESLAFTSAGTTIEVDAALPATNDAAGFEALTAFEFVGEVTDAGEFGREYNLVTHKPLADRRTVKRKGSYNDGSMSLAMARTPSDAGQAIMNTALDSDDPVSVKVTLQDGTVFYFTAIVMSYTVNVGSVDQITSSNSTIEITNDIVEVAPTP